MIKYEIKKLVSSKITVASLGGLILILAIISFINTKNVKELDNKAYAGYEEYSLSNYEKINGEYSEYLQELMACTDDNQVAEIIQKYNTVVEIKPIYDIIYNRINNIAAMTLYDNWFSDIQYSYDPAEKHVVGCYDIWKQLADNRLYCIIAILCTIIISTSVMLSDSRPGNRPTMYTTYFGKKRVINSKKIMIFISAVIVTVVCFGIHVIPYIIKKPDFSLLTAGVYHIQGFSLAPSYVSIGDYIIFSFVGVVFINLLISSLIYMLSSFFDKHVYVYIITIFVCAICYMMCNFTWITPAGVLRTQEFFNGIREVVIGNVVLHRYFVLCIVIAAGMFVCNIVGNILNRIVRDEK